MAVCLKKIKYQISLLIILMGLENRCYINLTFDFTDLRNVKFLLLLLKFHNIIFFCEYTYIQRQIMFFKDLILSISTWYVFCDVKCCNVIQEACKNNILVLAIRDYNLWEETYKDHTNRIENVFNVASRWWFLGGYFTRGVIVIMRMGSKSLRIFKKKAWEN